MTNFAPAYQARRDAAADNAAYVALRAERAAAAAAHDSYARITTLAAALAVVDQTVRDLVALPECELTAGEIYRHLADGHPRTAARLSQAAAWWDEDCNAGLRLLWRAANGRAVERGA